MHVHVHEFNFEILNPKLKNLKNQNFDKTFCRKIATRAATRGGQPSCSQAAAKQQPAAAWLQPGCSLVAAAAAALLPLKNATCNNAVRLGCNPWRARWSKNLTRQIFGVSPLQARIACHFETLKN